MPIVFSNILIYSSHLTAPEEDTKPPSLQDTLTSIASKAGQPNVDASVVVNEVKDVSVHVKNRETMSNSNLAKDTAYIAAHLTNSCNTEIRNESREVLKYIIKTQPRAVEESATSVQFIIHDMNNECKLYQHIYKLYL